MFGFLRIPVFTVLGFDFSLFFKQSRYNYSFLCHCVFRNLELSFLRESMFLYLTYMDYRILVYLKSFNLTLIYHPTRMTTLDSENLQLQGDNNN